MKYKPSINSHMLILIMASYFTVILNGVFFSKVYGYILDLETIHLAFSLTLPVFVFSFLCVLFSFFVVKGLTKPVFVPLLVVSAAASYASLQYGTIFDTEMMENIIQTDMAEAGTYLSLPSLIYVLVLGVLPASILSQTHIRYRAFGREILARGGFVILSVVVFTSVTFAFYEDYASVGRNNRGVQHYIVPNQVVYGTIKYALSSAHKALPFQELGDDAQLVHAKSEQPTLLVMVVGETARSDHFHLNGYPRQTNPYTEVLHMTSLGEVTTCGTATAQSVPCMFSFLDRKHYRRDLASHQSNVLDVINKSGVDVIWIDNDGGCKGVCNRIEHSIITTSRENTGCDGEFCFDEVLLERLDSLIKKGIQRDTLVVFHLIGSHGPTYYRRYPERFKTFLPDCQRSDIQNCTQDELVNTYDNTILYSDYILSEMVKRIAAISGQINTALFYMSDHGESLGEKGLFLHGMPYAIAPHEQKAVPGLFWMSESYANSHHLNQQCFENYPKKSTLTQDYLSHSLLSLMQVSTKQYDQKLDFIRSCSEVDMGHG